MLVGSDEMLAGRGLGQLVGLLNSGLPVKVLVLQSLESGLSATAFDRANLSLLALSQRNAFVAQTSLAYPDHLGDSFLQALAFDGPALLQVYAPSPSRHGFASEESVAMAKLAVTSRTMPLFRYSPSGGGVFGSRISLDGNPVLHEGLVPVEDGRITPADWAIRQQRFADRFVPLADDAAAPTPLHEWLGLDSRGRTRKTPFVTSDDRCYGMSTAMLEMAQQCTDLWRTLQELAGVVTPFTDDVEQQVRAELAAEHQSELDALKKSTDERIREIQAETEAQIASKIRSRLVQLVSRKKG